MAGQYNFTIEQGATFTRVIIWKDENGNPVDVTGYVARMQIRKTKGDSKIILSLDSGDLGGITLGTTDGKITITIPADVTADLNFDSGVYDLELEKSGVVTRLLEGRVTLSKEVTR